MIISRILTFLLGFFAIGLIVFIHELGHYFTARFFKVDVECLSFGMGPKVYSFYGKNTEFRISLFPFGGYCKMKGSLDLEMALKDKKRELIFKEEGSYFAISALKRIFIYLSGPIINVILAFLLLLFASIIPVERISNKAYVAPLSDYPDLFENTVGQSEIEKGDLILKLDGKIVRDYQEARQILSNSKGPIRALILRNEEEIEILLEQYGGSYGITLYQEAVIGNSSDPMLSRGDRIISVNGIDTYSTLDVYNAIVNENNIFIIDRCGSLFTYSTKGESLPFSWLSDITIRPDVPLLYSIPYALKETLDFFLSTIEAIGALLTFNIADARTVITGPFNAADSIGTISKEAFSISSNSGLRTLCYLLAIVSLSISIANILPIPSLDGGQILICLSELLIHRSLNTRTYIILQIFGLIAAFLIMASMYILDIKEYFF